MLYILCEIYTDKGFYIQCNQRFWDNICSTQNVNEPEAREIVRYMLSIDYFNQNMFYRFEILTSAGIQQTYFQQTQRRKNVLQPEEKKYLLPKSPDSEKERFFRVRFI